MTEVGMIFNIHLETQIKHINFLININEKYTHKAITIAINIEVNKTTIFFFFFFFFNNYEINISAKLLEIKQIYL